MKKIILLILFLAILFLPGFVQAQVSSDLLREYLFPLSYGADVNQNDIIGLRIYRNPDNKAPLTWYQNNVSNPKSSLPETKVDGYVALRDDRTVYIQASNVVIYSPPQPTPPEPQIARTISSFYTNIYVLAYNQNASTETVEIFNQMLANMKFNKNVMDIYCLKAQFESAKDSLRRDTIRKADFNKLMNIFESGPRLDLSAGTYVPNISMSTWPSWQATLGKQLGTALPVDPLNVMVDQLISCTANEQCATGQCSGGYCSACPAGYDPRTCWNERELKYHDIDGFVYQYNLGVLTIRTEYPQLLFPPTSGCFLGCNKGGNYYALGSCLPLPDNRYCATSGWIANVCGDNLIRCNEVCEGANCKAGCLSCVENFHAEGSLCEADTDDVATANFAQTLSTAEEIRWTGSGWSAKYATACKANAVLDGQGICHCKTNYHEEDGECVLNLHYFYCGSTPPETGATSSNWTLSPTWSLPANTVWNTIGGYEQDWDGQKWVPVETEPIYSETPATDVCHYRSAENYHWICVGTDCSSVLNTRNSCDLPAAATAVEIWKQGTNEEYVCTAQTCVDNATLTNGTCACNTNLTWDSTDKICKPDTRTFGCQNLPANSAWNNNSNGVYMQTWDVATSSWLPADSVAVHNDTAENNTCNYKCLDPYYHWDSANSQCVPNTCQGITPALITAAETSCGTDENTLVPADTFWQYAESCSVSKCEYTCNPTFHFENGKCMPNICTGEIPPNATICSGIGTGLISNLPFTVVSSPWNGIDNDCTGAQCEYKCNQGYFKDGNTCKSFNDFGFAYKVKTQWHEGGTGDLYDLHIENPDGQNTYDGTQKDDVISVGDYSQGYELVTLSKIYDQDANNIDNGNYNVWIREVNDHNQLLSDNCVGNLTAYVYAFDMTTPILSYPCAFVSNSGDLNMWAILHITMPSGLIEVGNN
jgi:hypothetical protein